MPDGILLILPELDVLEGVRLGIERTALPTSLFYKADVFPFLAEDFHGRAPPPTVHFLRQDFLA
jgi:hypothetical protein